MEQRYIVTIKNIPNHIKNNLKNYIKKIKHYDDILRKVVDTYEFFI